MAQDVLPGSPFLNNMNSAAEPFTRASIEDYTPQRWLLVRLASDAFCNPEASCGGRHNVDATRYVYSGFVACWISASIYGYYEAAYWCGNIAGSMDAVDYGFRRLASGTEGSDGVVRNSAQRYPNPTRILPINGADSHVGETESDKVRAQLRTTLDVDFRALRNQY
jgi:hypothetical protein